MVVSIVGLVDRMSLKIGSLAMILLGLNPATDNEETRVVMDLKDLELIGSMHVCFDLEDLEIPLYQSTLKK